MIDYGKRKMIKEFTEGHEIVGYYRNRGHEVSISVNDVKQYVPRNEWDMLMSSAVDLIKELNISPY